VDAGRIAIPVPADRRPGATTRAAAAIARQAGLGLEFVATAEEGHRERCVEELRDRCTVAAAAGAPEIGWRLLDGPATGIGEYVTWSGAGLCCLGSPSHRPTAAARPYGIPVLLIGPAWRPGGGVVRHVLAGLSGWRTESLRVASVAAALARRLSAELTMIEVVEPAWRRVEVPACTHLFWLARELHVSTAVFDSVTARRPDIGLRRFIDPDTVVVVGAPTHSRRLRAGVAGRLLRHSPAPVVVVPANCEPSRQIPAARTHRSALAR
jgi:nucleotide-binding universal stress UspA family protein